MGGYSDYRRNNPFKNQNQCNVTDWFKTGYSSQKQDAGAVIATMAPQMLMSIFFSN